MHARFERLTERRAVRQTRAAYEDAQGTILSGVRRSIRGSGPLDHRTRMALSQHVRTEQTRALRSLASEVAAAQAEAHRESLRGLARMVHRMEGRRSSVLDDTARFESILDRRRLTMQRGLDAVMQEQAHQIHIDVSERLSDAFLQQQTRAQVLGALGDTTDHAFWRVERAVRTEAAYAYNAAQQDGIDALADEFPDMMARWVEHVDDSTWQPMDKRVAPDSIALHGQVKPPDGLFTMPNDPAVSSAMWGRTWDFPPNRPNDRAIVMPWRRAWGIPAWVLTGSGRRWLVRRAA